MEVSILIHPGLRIHPLLRNKDESTSVCYFFAQTDCILKGVLVNEVELGSKTGNEMMTLNKVRGVIEMCVCDST